MATYLLIYRRIYQARFPKWLSIQKKKERLNRPENSGGSLV